MNDELVYENIRPWCIYDSLPLYIRM